MRRSAGRWTVASAMIGGAVVLALALYTSTGEASAQQPAVDFDKQVRPILAANCLECHSAEKRKGGLSLAAYADVLDGGRSGAVVRPGHAARSLLLSRVNGDPEAGDRMPLDATPLTGVEIATLKQWVDQGARPTPASRHWRTRPSPGTARHRCTRWPRPTR